MSRWTIPNFMSALLHRFLSELLIRQFLGVAGYTILVYDYLLTFDLEVDYIWCAPWTIVKVVFLLNRYVTLIGQSFIVLEELGILSHGSRKFCEEFQWFEVLLSFFSAETPRILLLLRSWALWRCSHCIAISLVSAYVFYVLVLGGIVSYIMFKYGADFDFPYLDNTRICVIYASVGVSSESWPIGLISFSLDTGMFAMIAYYLYKLCKELKQLHSPLLRLLVRDAVLFYMVNVLYDAVDMLTLTVFVEDPLNFVIVALPLPLLTVAGQRVVLNLRGFQSHAYTTKDISRLVDRGIAEMQHRSFWQSVDLWMNDPHQELELIEELSRYRTTESQAREEGGSHELDVIRMP